MVPTSIAELMVAVGRIEILVTPIAGILVRLAEAELEIRELKAKQKEPIKFITIITSIALAVTIIVGVTTLMTAKEERAAQQVQIEILKRSNEDLQNKVTP